MIHLLANILAAASVRDVAKSMHKNTGFVPIVAAVAVFRFCGILRGAVLVVVMK